jgi:hypothetical protein
LRSYLTCWSLYVSQSLIDSAIGWRTLPYVMHLFAHRWRRYNSLADILLLQNLHSRHPWRSQWLAIAPRSLFPTRPYHQHPCRRHCALPPVRKQAPYTGSNCGF